MTTDVDWSDLQRRLTDTERRVLLRFETAVVDFYQGRWVGWRYRGRPAGAPRLVSHDAWRGEVTTTEAGAQLLITNAARGWRSGRPYVAHVHRAGKDTSEWEEVTADAVARFADDIAEEMAAAIAATLEAPAPTRRIREGSSGTEVLNLEI